MSDILNIGVEFIHQHPDNPRKDLGDLTELSESIRKKGVMQNLTVIPGHWDEKKEWHEEDGYTLIIGHRRCAAAKLAGIDKLPCRIVEGMSKKEQVSIMLEENMQRNDLTYYEQAQGFQMMLDLGETEETIAEKTGFSKSTIRHRLNIAKLDQDVLKEKENNAHFQLSLKDLNELEKIEDVKERNKILKSATDSRDLVWKVQSAVIETKRRKKAEKLEEMLIKAGIEKAPKKAEEEQYSGKWEIVKDFNLEADIPKSLRLPKNKEGLFYLPYFRSIWVIKKKKKEKKIYTPEEIKRKEFDEKRKKLQSAIKEMDARRKDFIKNIIDGKIQSINKKDEEKVKEIIWKALVKSGRAMYFSDMTTFIAGKDRYKCTDEEEKAAVEKVDRLSCLHQMLIMLHYSMEGADRMIYDWYLHYQEDEGNALLQAYKILEIYGWSFANDDDMKILDGTHEFYKQEAENT